VGQVVQLVPGETVDLAEEAAVARDGGEVLEAGPELVGVLRLDRTDDALGAVA
jgi:hypothetical protein